MKKNFNQENDVILKMAKIKQQFVSKKPSSSRHDCCFLEYIFFYTSLLVLLVKAKSSNKLNYSFMLTFSLFFCLF